MFSTLPLARVERALAAFFCARSLGEPNRAQSVAMAPELAIDTCPRQVKSTQVSSSQFKSVQVTSRLQSVAMPMRNAHTHFVGIVAFGESPEGSGRLGLHQPLALAAALGHHTELAEAAVPAPPSVQGSMRGRNACR